MDRSEKPLMRGGRWPLIDYVLLAVVVVYYLLDPVPRFYQGDSLSYLGVDYTLRGWLTPDRSWVFGALASFILHRTHGYEDYILLQADLLSTLLLVLRRALAAEGRWPAAVVAAACLLAAVDPLVEIYTRFAMSDFLATAGFFLALCGAIAVFRSDRRPGLYAALAILPIFAAVLARSSYALAIEATLAIAFLLVRARLAKRQLIAFVCILATAPAAVGFQLAANHVLFRQRFPHETFMIKNSGVFLAGVFSPALAPADFAKAGVPISQPEFDQMNLKYRPYRNAQIWARSPRFLHQMLEDKLKTTDEYSGAVDHAAKALVFNALQRDPMAVLKVYLQNAADYFTPSQWRTNIETEMGLDHDLPGGFVEYSNAATLFKILPNITRWRSLLIRENLALSGVYPIQLAFGLFAAIWLLVKERKSVCCVFLASGALVTLAMAPLYSVYVIPRYLLMTVLANWVLIPLAAASIYRSMTVRRA
jgi:hypothetical protein